MSARTWGFKSPLRHRRKCWSEAVYRHHMVSHQPRGTVVDTKWTQSFGGGHGWTRMDRPRETGRVGRERGQAGQHVVLPDRPSAGSGRRATSEAGGRLSDRARGEERARQGVGGCRGGAAALRPDAHGGRPGGGVVGGGGPNRKATTVANYRTLVEAYLVPHIGAKRLDRLAASDIQRLYIELRGRGPTVVDRCRGPRSATSTGSCTTC